MNAGFDRGAGDVGNLVALDHVNLAVPEQRAGMLFYVSAMGFTRDPFLMVDDENMWINVGRQQLHLPAGAPQLLRGAIGIVVPDPAALRARLEAARAKLAGTGFGFAEEGGTLVATCPWGNRLRCHAPGPRFPGMTLGIAYVELAVRPGAAAGIARFYREVMGARCVLGEERAVASVSIGANQALVFRETRTPLPAYDGHHVAIYVADFSGPHRFLKQHDLVTEESNEHQYRFQDIFDIDTGSKLTELQHEVRSLRHPMFGRELANRNPAQSNRNYLRGADRLEC